MRVLMGRKRILFIKIVYQAFKKYYCPKGCLTEQWILYLFPCKLQDLALRNKCLYAFLLDLTKKVLPKIIFDPFFTFESSSN